MCVLFSMIGGDISTGKTEPGDAVIIFWYGPCCRPVCFKKNVKILAERIEHFLRGQCERRMRPSLPGFFDPKTYWQKILHYSGPPGVFRRSSGGVRSETRFLLLKKVHRRHDLDDDAVRRRTRGTSTLLTDDVPFFRIVKPYSGDRWVCV